MYTWIYTIQGESQQIYEIHMKMHITFEMNNIKRAINRIDRRMYVQL
jgi:hypothetical protein